MRVVVDEGHPVDLASELEAPSDTAEPGECCGRCGGRTTCGDRRHEGGRCVAGVVHARGRQLGAGHLRTIVPDCEGHRRPARLDVDHAVVGVLGRAVGDARHRATTCIAPASSAQ